MINTILKSLGLKSAPVEANLETRRKNVRYPSRGQVGVVIDGKPCGLDDWSLTGALFDLPLGMKVNVGDRMDLTLHFILPQEQIEISQTGRVVRAGKDRVAVAFLQNDMARHQMMRVIDSLNTQDFLESQQTA